MTVQRPKYDLRRFDFEVGHLKKSPCKGCFHHFQFPVCLDECAILDRIQTKLSRTVLTSCNHSPAETFAIQIEDWRKKS